MRFYLSLLVEKKTLISKDNTVYTLTTVDSHCDYKIMLYNLVCLQSSMDNVHSAICKRNFKRPMAITSCSYTPCMGK